VTWQSIPLRAAILIEAPVPAVLAALRRVDVWQRAAAAVGFRLTTDAEHSDWQPDDTAVLRRSGRQLGRPQHVLEVRVGTDGGLPEALVIGGPASGALLRVLAAPTAAGVLVTLDFGNPHRGDGPVARVRRVFQARFRRDIVWALQTVLGIVTLEQHLTKIVVGAALIRDDRVLAARRSYPADLAGKWEFPGGKVAPGEQPEGALAREIHEEFGVDVTVGDPIGPLVGIDVEVALQLYRVDIPADLQLSETEHDEIRWLAIHDLESVDWLPADLVLLPYVADALRRRSVGVQT
jgi:8-oxo-dGTP diphosphatase